MEIVDGTGLIYVTKASQYFQQQSNVQSQDEIPRKRPLSPYAIEDNIPKRAPSFTRSPFFPQMEANPAIAKILFSDQKVQQQYIQYKTTYNFQKLSEENHFATNYRKQSMEASLRNLNNVARVPVFPAPSSTTHLSSPNIHNEEIKSDLSPEIYHVRFTKMINISLLTHSKRKMKIKREN